MNLDKSVFLSLSENGELQLKKRWTFQLISNLRGIRIDYIKCSPPHKYEGNFLIIKEHGLVIKIYSFLTRRFAAARFDYYLKLFSESGYVPERKLKDEFTFEFNTDFETTILKHLAVPVG